MHETSHISSLRHYFRLVELYEVRISISRHLAEANLIITSVKAVYCLSMKDVAVLDGEWDLYHLDDVLASQYQSSDWTVYTT